LENIEKFLEKLLFERKEETIMKKIPNYWRSAGDLHKKGSVITDYQFEQNTYSDSQFFPDSL